MPRAMRLVFAAAGLLLAVAQFAGWGGIWMLPLSMLCLVGAVIERSERTAASGDDDLIVLDLHR